MAVLLALVLLVVACGDGQASSSTLGGALRIDGSSTVFPITEAVAEEFNEVHPRVRVNVGVAGTGGGFERFVTGTTAINNASRPISELEAERAAQNGIEYLELPVAIDGIAVVINPRNDFVDCLAVEQLRAIWEPESAIDSWSDINPEWPDEPLRLYGPATDSGTFDYFTETIVGEAQASRPDYTASEDDNILVQGVSGDRNALGYFGYAYYSENSDILKAVAIDGGGGCVLPTGETIENGTYQPLSRPIFIYVNTESLERPEVMAFVEFYMQNAAVLAAEVGYIPLPPQQYQENLEAIQQEPVSSFTAESAENTERIRGLGIP